MPEDELGKDGVDNILHWQYVISPCL